AAAFLQAARDREQPPHPGVQPVEDSQTDQDPQLVGGHEGAPSHTSRTPASSHGAAARATVRKGSGAERDGPGRAPATGPGRTGQISPWASIASATISNPAMLAPAT